MSTLSGSISLWSILGDSGPIEVLLWCFRGHGRHEGSEDWSKLIEIKTFFAVFVYFHIPKVGNDTFTGSLNSWRLLGHFEPTHVYFFDILKDQRGQEGSENG